MNEACLNAKWIDCDLTNKKAQEFTKNVLNFMREKLSDYQEMYGDLYNLEATPAESTSFRLAKHDVKRFPDIKTASQGNTPYYTNSSHLPVWFTDDVFTALDIQDELQTLYTSGTVFHAFLGEKLPDWKSAAALVKKIAENYKLPYYTLSPTYSVCKNHGYLIGEQYKCPICGETAEVYSRITGYYRPVQNWNDGKAQEFKERKVYSVLGSIKDEKERLSEGCVSCVPQMINDLAAEGEQNFKLILCATKTCPKCAMVSMFLERAGLEYEKMYAEDNEQFFIDNGVQEAPTLLVVRGDKVEKYANPSNIRKFIDQVSASAN